MTLNEAISTYMEQHARETEAKKQADAAKKFILAMCEGLDEITTDVYRVYIKRTSSVRLDSAALYKDFPDIKETYGIRSVSVSIDPHVIAAAAGKTA